jgi:bifunctional non-homologous end joining protein LigD
MAELAEYRRKRRFAETPEPRGPESQAKKARKDEKVFVIQKHAARRLHYDLRLEVGGVLKSWAVPKGPSLNPGDKRLAVQVEDHPFEYRKFEGTIPEGNYGAGEVIIWDQGTYEPEGPLSAAEQLERGELKFRLHGHKLNGSFVLVKLKHSRGKNEWLIIKHRDDYADPMWDVEQHGESVVSGRPLPKTQKEQRKTQDSAAPNPADLPGARSGPMPRDVSVTLAKIADKPFSDPNWLFEIKWDGIRTVAYLENGAVSLFSRSKREVTAEFPEFQDLARYLRAGTAILDGEIVTLDENGRSDFQKLQNRFGVTKPSQQLITEVPLTYYLFDVLYCNGFDVRKTPLLQRKQLLRQVLRGDDRVRFSEHQLEKGKELYAVAKEKGLEGIVGKHIESPYTGNRTGFWLKFKIVNELDAVVVGWTAPRRTRQYFGALVLALYDENKELQFIGSAGTGFGQKTQKDLLAQLEELRVARSPLRNPPKLREHVEWVRPAMVARIKFANWTEDNHLRAPVFLGIRKDRTPEECTFDAARPERAEKAETTPAKKPLAVEIEAKPSRSKTSPNDAGFEELAHGSAESLRLQVDGRTLALTHLNKIYFPESGVRKRDLIAYYYRIADHILPFLKDRPLVMRRYPNGIQEKSFFQKEAPESIPDWIERATVYSDERGGEMDYVMAQDRPSLLFLTNLGCIDHNPWSSRFDNQDYPDYVFFDLDPTPDTPFTTVLRVARSIYKVLASTRLSCFLKTSGATGFHIYIPLEPIYKYAQTRTFAEIISQIVASELPRDTTLERSVRKRPPGRVLLDALQNAKGKPLAAVYSARAHPGATVSTPVTAEELMNGNIDPDAWTIKTLFSRLQSVGDLWKDFWSKRQTLDAALEALSHRLSGEKQRSKGSK